MSYCPNLGQLYMKKNVKNRKNGYFWLQNPGALTQFLAIFEKIDFFDVFSSPLNKKNCSTDDLRKKPN